MVLSSSRDRSVIVWELTPGESKYGYAVRRMTGHSHFVQDVALSHDGHFALSGSWDGTLRLWNVDTGACTEKFVGHTKDVLSVAFSADNRQIVSGSRDKTINLWNTVGVRKATLKEGGHEEWVSCVRFSPHHPIVVSAGWDKVVKVWDLPRCRLKCDLTSPEGHTDYVNSVTVSPDGSLCASGGKDGRALLWDLNEGALLNSLECDDIIHSLVFSPVRYWLCAATASAIKIFNLETRDSIAHILVPQPQRPADQKRKRAIPIQCISLAWSKPDGTVLFAGCTDNVIRVYHVEITEA